MNKLAGLPVGSIAARAKGEDRAPTFLGGGSDDKRTDCVYSKPAQAQL